VVRALGAGKPAMSPAFAAAITNSGEETRNIGATIKGNLVCSKYFIDQSQMGG
jgi:hypothetical protein